MRGARLHLLSPLLLLGACATEPVLVSIPFEAGDRAAVVAVVANGQTRYWAVDTSLREMQPILQSISGWTPEVRVEVHIVYFRDDLESIGLSAGAAQSEAEGSPLPDGVRTLTGVLDGSDEVQWTERSSRPPELEDFRVRLETPCRRFSADSDRLFLPDDQFPLGFAEDAGGEVWLVTTESPRSFGRVMRVRDGAFDPPIELPSDFRARAMVAAEDGGVFVAGGVFGQGAQVLYGALGEQLELWAESPGGSSSAWPSSMIRSTSSTVGPMLWTLSTGGTLSRVRQDRWQVALELGTNGTKGAIAEEGPERLFVIPTDGGAVLRVEEGVARPDRTGIDEDLVAMRDVLESVAWIPGLGAFIGSDSGILLRREGASWTVAAPNTLIDSTIEVIVPFRSGVMSAGRYGIVDQYYDGLGYCASERVFVGMNVTITALRVVGDRVIVGGVERLDSGQRRYFVQWLTPADASRD